MRRRSQSCQSHGAAPASDSIEQLKRRSKSSSATAARRWSSSKLMKKTINIDDLPEAVLVEILCRLPGKEFLFQCKCVSKRWSALISNSYLINRFVCLQIDKQTPIIRTLIDEQGEEFLNRMPRPSWSSKPLTPLFEKLMRFYSLKIEPTVVTTFNDLIVCCESKLFQRDYYICNPCTRQWVALPPALRCERFVAVGFMCEPYCKQEDVNDGDQKKQPSSSSTGDVSINSEYRCMLVRLILPYWINNMGSKFIAEVYSSETGEWRESIVSAPQEFVLSAVAWRNSSLVYNGMIYWMSFGFEPYCLIGLDPSILIKNSRSCTSTRFDDLDHTLEDYRCRFIHFDDYSVGKSDPDLHCYGVHAGCIRMFDYDYDEDAGVETLFVWDLKEEDLMMAADGGGKFCFKPTRKHPKDPEFEMESEDSIFNRLGFDPSNDEIFYASVDLEYIVVCNTRTGRWTKMDRKKTRSFCAFPLALPWWPTPVPRLRTTT